MDRKEVLLRACYDLLMKQVESGYALNLLEDICDELELEE